jgi:Zn-dependent peptidase ImmA (M78 family)
MTGGKEWYAGVPAEESLSDSEKRELRIFEILCRHFAYLERIIVGEVSFELPNYAGSGLPVLEGTMEDQGTELARRERERLVTGDGPVVGVRDMLDNMGIKVIAMPMPEGSDVDGGFLFRSDVGPCIMLNSSLSARERVMEMAHQYCHFLADFDPYLPRVCLGGTPPGVDLCEDRARSFALEFFVPEESLVSLLSGGDFRDVGGPELDALAIYFGVPPRAIAEQLGRLGLGSSERREGPDVRERVSSDEGSVRLPERFVRLAVEARSKGLISDVRMGRLLRTSAEVAQELAAYFSAGEVSDGE